MGMPHIKLCIPSEFKKIAEELEVELGHKLIICPQYFTISAIDTASSPV